MIQIIKLLVKGSFLSAFTIIPFLSERQWDIDNITVAILGLILFNATLNSLDKLINNGR